MALALGGCLKAQSTVARETGCRSCHEAHYVREGTCQECHRGNPGAERQELAHAQLLTGRATSLRLPEGPALREGQALVEALACRRCHTIGGKGNRLATALDGVVWKREQAQLVSSIREPVENMPRFGLDEGQAEAIVAFLLRSGSADEPQDTYRVRFVRATSATSGLFTPFYPPTAPGNRPWTEKALAHWLKNPRASRPAPTMPPVALREDELRQVVAELGGQGPGSAAR